MAGRNGDTAKHLAFIGPDLPHVGYGRMFVSLRDTLATKVNLNDRAEHVVYAMQPDMVKGWYHGQKATILTMWGLRLAYALGVSPRRLAAWYRQIR